MTDAETEVVSEYAASLLLKYDAENHSRLINTSSYMDKYMNALLAYNKAEEEYYAKLAYEEELRKQEALNQKEEAEKYAGSTSVNDGTGGATIIDGQLDNVSLASYLDLDNFNIEYSGYELLNSYPDDSQDDLFFSCVATKGSKLLVVYFDATNMSGDTQRLDIFNKGAKFKLNVNGTNKKDTLLTLLEDNLSEYLGDFNGNESKKLVLIREVPEDCTVESITLSSTLPGKNTITNTLY